MTATARGLQQGRRPENVAWPVSQAKEGGDVKCVLVTYPSYVWLSALTIAGIVVLGLFTATELTILIRNWRLARQDAAWSRIRHDDEKGNRN